MLRRMLVNEKFLESASTILWCPNPQELKFPLAKKSDGQQSNIDLEKRFESR